MDYDVIIVGAGPAGLFTAVEMLLSKTKRKILIIDKGQSAEKRYCNITTDFSGVGAFSDGMPPLFCGSGGTLHRLIGEEKTQDLIDYTDTIYLEFGAEEHMDGPIRHLNAEMAQRLYTRIEKYLLDNGVEIRFGTAYNDIIFENGRCTGVICSGRPIYGLYNVFATGRKGADWLKRICVSHGCSDKSLKKDNAGRIEMDERLKTNIEGLYCPGDCSGWTRGFMMASVMGVLMGQILYYPEFAQRVFMGDRCY